MPNGLAPDRPGRGSGRRRPWAGVDVQTERRRMRAMAVTAALVKDLREKTGAGMMDCKKALNETNGDLEAAVDWLRTKGLAAAAKKSGRVATERSEEHTYDLQSLIRMSVAGFCCEKT